MDKFSVGGSSIHGALQILFYLLPEIDRESYAFKIVGLRRDLPVTPPESAKHISIVSLNLGKFNVFTVFSLIRIVRREKPRILHLHGYASWNFGRLAGFLTGTPVVLQEHMAMDASPLYQKVADSMLSPLNGQAIAVSENVRRFMVARRSVLPENLQVIPNGVPLGNFPTLDPAALTALKAELGISESSLISGAIGRLDPIKGHRFILEAMPSIRDRFPDSVLLIIGDGPLLGELKDSVLSLGIERQVRFLGHRTDVPRLLQVLDVFIMASLSEGMSIAAGEAMASGKAILASDCEGLKAMLDPGSAALFFRSQDSGDLAEKWGRLLEDADLRSGLAEKSRKLSKTYDIKTTARAYTQIYDQL